MNWYAKIENDEVGPLSAAQLKRLVTTGKIREGSLVKRQDMDRWIMAGSVRGLIQKQPSVGRHGSEKSESDPSSLAPSEDTDGQLPEQLNEPPIPANTTAVTSTHPSNDHRRLYITLIVGAVFLLAFSILIVAGVMGGLGVTWLRKTDEEAVLRHQKELAEQDAKQREATEAEIAAEKHEQFLNASFVSKVAANLRSRIPARESELYHFLVNTRMQGIPSKWTEFDPVVQQIDYSGNLCHGSPVLLNDDTIALLYSNGGLELSLWHLDLRAGNLRKISDINKGAKSGRYHTVNWHRKSSELIGEFVTLRTAPRGGYGFVSQANYGWLNPRTGTVQLDSKEYKTNKTAQIAEKNALRLLWPEESRVTPTNGEKALALAQTRLREHDLEFDPKRRATIVAELLRDEWYKQVSRIGLTSPDAPSKLHDLHRIVVSAPSSKLTRDFAAAIELAEAAAANNGDGVASYLSQHAGHYLNRHALLEKVHLIAMDTDSPREYLDFINQDPQTRAGDLAVMRVHELAFREALEEATPETFDRFSSAFPGALQTSEAIDIAFDLTVERAVFAVEHAEDKDKKMEQVANGFYVQWRDALRDNDWIVAERAWKVLTEADGFNQTEAAKEAQDSKDRDIYRKKMLEIQERRNQILEQIRDVEEAQRQQASSLQTLNDLTAEQNGLISKQNRILKGDSWF